MPTKTDDRSRTALSARIRTLRAAAGLTQAQLASALLVTKNAVTNWEAGTARPDLALLPALSRMLGTSCDALLGAAPAQAAPTREELRHLAAYRRLTAYDRRSVDALIQSMTRGYDQAWLSEHRNSYLRLPEYGLRFAAGSGHPLDDESQEPVFIPDSADARRADFIVHVSGQSMEPTFPDGSRVLVERRDALREGEIGIFRLADGEGLIKEYRRDGLHSHNPSFPVRSGAELYGLVCLGRVLGLVDEDAVPDARQAALLEEDWTQRREDAQGGSI